MLQELAAPKLGNLACPSQTWTVSNRSSTNYRDSYQSDVDNLPDAGTLIFDRNRGHDANEIHDDDNFNWLIRQFRDNNNNNIGHSNGVRDPDLNSSLNQYRELAGVSYNPLQTQNDRTSRRDSTSSISSCTLSRVSKLKSDRIKTKPNQNGSHTEQQSEQYKSDYHYFPRLNVKRDPSVDSRKTRTPSGGKTSTVTNVGKLISDIKCKMILIRKMDQIIMGQLNRAGEILRRAKLAKANQSDQPKGCGRRQLITKQNLMQPNKAESIHSPRSRTKEPMRFLSSHDLLNEWDNGDQEYLNNGYKIQDNAETRRWSNRFIESPWGQVQVSKQNRSVQQELNNQNYSPRIGNLIKLPKYNAQEFDSQESDLNLSDDKLLTSDFSLNTTSLRNSKKEHSMSQTTLTTAQDGHFKLDNASTDAFPLFNKSINLKNLSSRLRNPFRRKDPAQSPMRAGSPLQQSSTPMGRYRRSASLSQFQTPTNLYSQNSMPNNLELETLSDEKLPFIKPKLVPFGIASNFR